MGTIGTNATYRPTDVRVVGRTTRRFNISYNVSVRNFRTLSKADGIPVLFMTNVIAVIRHVTDGVPIPSSFPHDSIEHAVLKQADIGYYHFVVGFLSNEWTAALDELKVDQPKRKMEKILTVLWDSLCEEVWMIRNGIRHSKENHVSSDELETMAEKTCLVSSPSKHCTGLLASVSC